MFCFDVGDCDRGSAQESKAGSLDCQTNNEFVVQVSYHVPFRVFVYVFFLLYSVVYYVPYGGVASGVTVISRRFTTFTTVRAGVGFSRTATVKNYRKRVISFLRRGITVRTVTIITVISFLTDVAASDKSIEGPLTKWFV